MRCLLLLAAVAAHASELPLLSIARSASAPWALPNPVLPFPVGPNPGLELQGHPASRRLLQPPAPHSLQGLLLGDIRAHLRVTPAVAAAQTSVKAQIFWRRRDPHPEIKAVVVTDAAGVQVRSTVTALESICGLVEFDHTGPGEYYVYYLPHYQTGGGAGVHFSWFNCSDPTHGRTCVLGTRPAASSSCTAADPSSTAVVVELENRPNQYGEHDHTPSGEPFHGFTSMELVAAPSELSGLEPGMRVFMEPRENPIRMFDQLPAHWARGGEVTSLEIEHLMAGEYVTFQAGVWAKGRALSNLAVSFTPLTGSGKVVPASAFTCFNLGGTDQSGEAFSKNVSVPAGRVAALWFGLELPSDVAYNGTFEATITVSSAEGPSKQLMLRLHVAVPPNGQPVPLHGDGDVYKMSRLRWLDSTLGVDEQVTAPFTNLTASPVASGGIAIQVINKRVLIGADGLPAQATVTATKLRQGRNVSVSYPVLSQPVQFVGLVDGKATPMHLTQPATLVSVSPSTARWSALMDGGGMAINVTGSMDFDSYLTYEITVSASQDVDLSDIQLKLSPTNETARMICGMGTDGAYLRDLSWVWDVSQGNNRLWLGRVEAGVYFYPRGDGTHWENPNYSKDYPTLPFIPESWGGVGSSKLNKTTVTGATVRGGLVTTSSGARMLTAGESVSFLFDMAFTPSKPLDLRHHWRSRYLQIGYGVDYTSPQDVASMGVTVATLHQGIGGIHNGSMVNPYINWPFVPDVVQFMENYTAQAHALGVQVKFYYTIRELTNHVAELFALKALQGEILTPGDPYTIPQVGYNHDWDAHGGGAYLHQHLVENYISCWQQGLANGETDASVCDQGTSRWFNYYLEGAFWSISQAPHIDGIYYDGINFDRRGMRRVRKVLDRASRGKKFAPLIDIHTGNIGVNSPSAVSYLSHFPYADSAWCA